MTTATYTLNVAGLGPVPLTVEERGEGRPFLLLHGGGGMPTVASFAELLAAEGNVRVITPLHPGFGGTERPEALSTSRGLAQMYGALLEHLSLEGVTVMGNSIGGWIAAEMLLIGSPRISGVVLVNAVGIEVPGHPAADFFSMTMPEVAQHSYHDPAKFGIDLSKLPPPVLQIIAKNREALAVYSGGPAMCDASLIGRLGAATVPTLVLWGESDRMVDAEYGKAWAEAIPGARFQLLKETGHLPQIETPGQVLGAVTNFMESVD